MSLVGKIGQQTNNLSASIGRSNTIQARSVAVAGGAGTPVIALTELTDVDTAALADGSVLIYNAATEKFETKSEVENENLRISGGSF
jgi:hypothetical protein